jgi:hypothetical protein
MYLRYATVRRGDKVYRYAQLVESYRREDGKSTNRVLLNLGVIEPEAAENLKLALEANRRGKGLVLAKEMAGQQRPEIIANLCYLDLAVLLRLWKELGLDQLVGRAVPPEERTVPVADIIAALVLQRCVAPASKLAAEAWYDNTALPELQNIAPQMFNNSRVHRALNALDHAESSIQAGLPALLARSEGAFATLFVDATDTWFTGAGPDLAHKARDKEGIYRRRVGLIMLCDQRGFPLRWHTLDGRFHDPTSLADMAREAAKLPWARSVPLVMDRAAGHAGATQALHELGLQYITALPDSELISSNVPIPWMAIDDLQAETSPDGIASGLLAAGFVQAAEDRFILDLGIFKKARSKSHRPTALALSALQLLEKIEAEPNTGPSRLAAQLGTSSRRICRHKPLLSLCPAARSRIRTGDIDKLDLADLIGIARLPVEQQLERIEQLQADPARMRHSARRGAAFGYDARAVVSFSPSRLLENRRHDEENVASVATLVEDVNRRLAHRSSRRTDASAIGEVTELIRKHGLGSVLSVEIVTAGPSRQIVVHFDEAAWRARRRGDGINVIVAHPSVAGTGAELVTRYFEKDTIEKDFQTIKSVIELRPIHHRTDPKVRAHVTICVLALLLLRVLGARLTRPHATVLREFKEARLNLLIQGKTPYYTITRPRPGATELLKKLGYDSLIDERVITESITPR